MKREPATAVILTENVVLPCVVDGIIKPVVFHKVAVEVGNSVTTLVQFAKCDEFLLNFVGTDRKSGCVEIKVSFAGFELARQTTK